VQRTDLPVQASRPSTNNWRVKLLKIMEPCEVEAKKMEILLTCFQLQRLTSLHLQPTHPCQRIT
jgi:hypothetical protein